MEILLVLDDVGAYNQEKSLLTKGRCQFFPHRNVSPRIFTKKNKPSALPPLKVPIQISQGICPSLDIFSQYPATEQDPHARSLEQRETEEFTSSILAKELKRVKQQEAMIRSTNVYSIKGLKS
eukprot:TRINITY_DN916_c0_g1_i4.p2 TRINITY_DN916_c0_g1~~TRINITY_DN916_c0_g1_i4.p2  ORF type:complete len:123 (-),score=12.55 TRINITY_DN916_c0_g1_i4:242-610(-)